jgi:hypothetical protein
MNARTLAANFLSGEKSERWSFNYWARTAEEHLTLPYPDDLDDTCAALAALAGYDDSIIDGRAFSAIAKILIAREVGEGGPYRIWLTSHDIAPWQDVDIVVNSTIGYFLSLIGVHLPALDSFIGNAIFKNRLASPYYPSVFHISYFLSRYYSAKHKDANNSHRDVRAKLAEIIRAQLGENGRRKITVLEKAMAISSLIALGHPATIDPTEMDIFASQLEYEGFLPYAFCIDPSREGRRCYAGASALTAAFCAEAFARYADMAKPARPQIPSFYDHIRNMARTSIQEMGRPLREVAMAQIEHTSDESITAIASEFRVILYKNGKVLPMNITEQLSLANLYGWMAYKIYDDLLDDEGDPSLLPCANFFSRSLTEIYAVLRTRGTGMRSLFDHTMNRVDNAHAWEQKYCRTSVGTSSVLPKELPSFGDHRVLADRSIGHAMGPLAELLLVGYSADSEEYKNLEGFFRYYLIARQLHDDAHDWSDDLLRGRINSISTLVICHFWKEHHEAASITIAKVIPMLKRIFWEVILDVAANMIALHTAAARQAREASSILGGTDFMEDALKTLESGAQRAVKERNETLIFLNDYKGYPPTSARP